MFGTTKKWLRSLATLSLAGGIAPCILGEASAADHKAYPGTLCVQINDVTPEIVYNRLRATNTSASDKTWTCPAVRDIEAGDVIGWTATVHRDGNTTDDWVIFINICSMDMSSCDGDSITVPKINGTQTLAGFLDSVGNEETYGPLFIRSEVPDSGRIYKYTIGEE